MEYLKDYRNKNGHAPNDIDFHILSSYPENTNVRVNMLNEIVRQQHPVINKDELVSLFKAKQNSIRDFRSFYSLTILKSKNQKADAPFEKSIYEFCFSKNKMLYDRKEESDQSHTRLSYDGKKIITLMDLEGLGEQHKHASFSPSEQNTMIKFMHPFMPLTLAMLFDTQQCSFPYPNFNFLSFLVQKDLVVVYEKKEIVDKRECIVVASLSQRIYLDVNYDFSIIRIEHYAFKRENGKKIRYLLSKTSLNNLRDYGNGIWLPNSIQIEHFNPLGNITDKFVVDVSTIEINKNIPDNYFTDFIPDNVIVADSVNNLVYAYKDRPSIEETLKSVIQRKNITIFRWISLISGLALILIVLVIKYRLYIKNKRERENKTEEEEETK
jgi:hypothetical protein